MSGIRVVAHLVRCAADLLLCNDIDTEHLRFADAEECRNRLPVIVGEFQRVSVPGDVVMGRCRFLLERPPTATARPTLPARPRADVDVAGNAASFEPSAP
jgi:hypothetical protein